MQILEEHKVLSVIWLGMATKYLDKNKDPNFEREFDMIWRCWKNGELI